MKRKILDFSVLKEEISQNNVLEMAELIAFMELRFQIGYQGSRMQKNVCRLICSAILVIWHKKAHCIFANITENI